MEPSGQALLTTTMASSVGQAAQLGVTAMPIAEVARTEPPVAPGDASVAKRAEEGQMAKDVSMMRAMGIVQSDATPSIVGEVGWSAMVMTPVAMATRAGPTVT